jgi:tetratricopeptide (TPR) repeat protein
MKTRLPRLLALLAAFAPGLFVAAPASAQPGAERALAAAQAALDEGRTDEAIERVTAAFGKEPKNARALLVRSTARCLDGDLERCKADLDRALALDPGLRQGWLNRSALAIADKRYDDALAALAEAERLDPAALDNGLNQGAVLLLQGKLETAAARFQEYLGRNAESADALYLVATNYAFSGYAALAIQHLERAIARDERQRPRARVDANFADLAAHPSFQRLLTTDGFRPPAGSATAERLYRVPWQGSATPLLVALLNALQAERTPIDPRVEVTDEWALVWAADLRIKLAKRGEAECALELVAPPGRFAPPEWEARCERLFETLELELLKLEKRGGS